MLTDNDTKLDYSDVLLVPNRSALISRNDVETTIPYFDEIVTPVIAANMDGVGTFAMAKELGKLAMMTALVKHYTLEELVEFYSDNQNLTSYAIYSMGMSVKDRHKFVKFNQEMEDSGKNPPTTVCVDVANGYTRQFEEFLAEMSETYPQYILMAGNVVTPDQTDRLIECGVDIVKVGIGPGSVCTTRRLTGVGFPQFSAVVECSEAARDAGGMVVADGGITCPGDAAKAFGAGANLIMLGGYLAGHDEGGGKINSSKSPSTIKFYGMASKEAQEKHHGGLADYRASEGKVVEIPYKGKVSETLKELLGGLRSACTYIGAESIDQMHRKAKFIRVNRQLNNVYGS